MKNGRHAVVDALHIFISGAGDNDAAVIPTQAREGKEWVSRQVEVIGLFALPLIEAVGGNKAAVGGEEMLECRAFGECLGAGIDDGCI